MAGDGKPKKDSGGKGQGKKKKPQDKKGGRGTSSDLVTALSHEMRRRILREMHDRDDDSPVSPAQLSDRFTAPLSAVSYHVRVLEKYGAIRLVDERPVRGALEHFYISLIRNNPTLRALLDETEQMDEESRKRIRDHEEKTKRKDKD